MLQSIRDHTQGWIAGIIISLLILSFALWGISSYLLGGSANTIVAKVNGAEITKSQLAVAYERLRRQLQSQISTGYTLPANAETALKERALQTLVNIQVLRQASIKQDYRISERQIDNYLENMPEFQVNGQFSLSRFQQLLATTLFNASDFLELIRTTLLIDQPRLGVIFSSFPLPNEVTNAISLVNQERHIQYAILPSQRFLSETVTVPEERILSYYQQHQDDYKTPEQASIEYLELTLNSLMAGIHPTDMMLKNFYNENTNSFAQSMEWKLETLVLPVADDADDQELTQMQNKINEIYRKAQMGAGFNDLKKEYPLLKADTHISSNWVGLDQVPTELQKALISLTKAGQIANPVRAANGFVLIKAAGVKDAVIQPFEMVKAKVSEVLTRQLAEEKFANLREKLANMTYEHPESLEPAAKALDLAVRSSEVFTRDKGSKDISSNNKIREATFSNDVLSLHNNSDVIQVGSDTAIVLRVKTHAPATLLSLSTVQKQITEKLKSEEIDAKTFQLANEIKQKLQNGAAPDQIAQQYQLTWDPVGFIPRHSTKVDSAILNTAFEMPKPAAGKNMSFAVAKVPTGYAIIGLSTIKEGTLTSAEDANVFAEQIQNSQGLLEYELYKQSLMKQAKISIQN
jgi:peptidyl-prolyl cis-trans isomerase D